MADPAPGLAAVPDPAAGTFPGRRQEIEGLRDAIAEVERNWGHRARLPDEARRLEESLITRRLAAASLMFRLEAARRTVDDLAGQMRAVDNEIAGLERGLWAVLSRVLEEAAEWAEPMWSPAPVLGYRLWLAGARGMRGATGFLWDRPYLSARCLRGGGADDRVPHTDGRCGKPPCGIYVVKDAATLLRFGMPGAGGDTIRVVGLTALTGKVVEHEAGYRAQHARVVAVAVLHGGRVQRSDDLGWIDRLFRDPLSMIGEPDGGSRLDAAAFTGVMEFFEECTGKEEQKWT